MPNVTTLRRSFLDHCAAHPRIGLALRTGLAASLAWLVVRFIPGAEQYPYYAPLGAVAATSVSVVSTLRESVRSVLAIVAGALIAVGANAVLDPGVLTVAVVVGLGVGVAGLPLFGDLGSWVPTSALFVLIIGDGERVQYPLVYSGLILLGGLIGTLVAVVFPQLPLVPTERATARLRRVLMEQLEWTAEGLEADSMPDEEEWSKRALPLDHWMGKTRQALAETNEASRWNLYAAGHGSTLLRVRRQAKALERTAWLVEDLAEIISVNEGRDNEAPGLGPELRLPTAAVLRAIGEVLGSISVEGAEQEQLAAAGRAVDDLIRQLGEARTPSEDGFHVASNVVNSARRILFTLRRDEFGE